MDIRSIIDSLAHGDIARQSYAAITSKWGAVGIAIALAIAIIVGVVLLGYDVNDVQSWFAGLGA